MCTLSLSRDLMKGENVKMKSVWRVCMWFVTVQVKHTAGLMRTPSLNATIFGLSKVAWCESYSWYGESYVVRDAIWEGNPGLSRGPRAGPDPGTCQSSKSRHWAVVGGSKMSRLYPFPSWSNHLDRRHQFNPQALLLPMSFKTLVYLTQTAFQVYQYGNNLKQNIEKACMNLLTHAHLYFAVISRNWKHILDHFSVF